MISGFSLQLLTFSPEQKYGNVDLVKYVDVGATCYFNKNMSAYVDYKINLLKDDNPASLSADNLVAMVWCMSSDN